MDQYRNGSGCHQTASGGSNLRSHLSHSQLKASHKRPQKHSACVAQPRLRVSTQASSASLNS